MNFEKYEHIMIESLIDENKRKTLPEFLKYHKSTDTNILSNTRSLMRHFAYWIYINELFHKNIMIKMDKLSKRIIEDF